MKKVRVYINLKLGEKIRKAYFPHTMIQCEGIEREYMEIPLTGEPVELFPTGATYDVSYREFNYDGTISLIFYTPINSEDEMKFFMNETKTTKINLL